MIVCFGLSPALQRTLVFDRIALGSVNRARQAAMTAAGKALNAARVIHQLGGESLVVQAAAGMSGRLLTSLLEADGVGHETVFPERMAPTRICTTLLADGADATELVEEATAPDPAGLNEVLRALREAIPRADALLLSGSLPEGVPPGLYATLLQDAYAAGVPVAVDVQKAPLALALPAKPFLVKPNVQEAADTLQMPLTGDVVRDAIRLSAALCEAGATWALVSMGRAGAVIAGPDGVWRIESPSIAAVNAIGAGDSLGAGLLHARFHKGMPVPEAAMFGAACAAANCLTLTAGTIRPHDVEALLPQVRLTQIG